MTWWTGRLGAALVTFLFVGTVVTPLFFMREENTVRQEIRSYVLPAYLQTAHLQTYLDHELSGIIGFQMNGEPRFAKLYGEERSRLIDSVNELSMLTRHLGGNTQDHWKDVVTALAEWDATVEHEGFLRSSMNRSQFNQELFQSDYVLEEAHQAVTDFQFAVQKAWDLQRERITDLQRENSLLTRMFAVMALLSLFFVWRLVKRLRDAQTELLSATEEQKMLVEQAENRRTMAENAVQFRDEILRIVSHDLRNPVTKIALTASILRNTSGFATEDTRRLLDMIKRGTDHMNGLIRNLIEIGRVESGRDIALDITDVTAHSLVQEACEAAKVLAEQKQIVLWCQSGESNMPLQADRDRLLQVLNNLIDNAIKFTPRGGSVVVTSEVTASEARFSVSDTGIGIDREYLSLIFERYWQVPGAKRGTGLGLAIAKRIVERHGGRIWAESQSGQGTTFYFVVPRVSSCSG